MKECNECGVKLSSANTTEAMVKQYIHKCTECYRNQKARLRRMRRERNPQGATAQQMDRGSRFRAKKKGIDHSLNVEFIQSIFPSKCPILGKKLKYGCGGISKYSASIDRIDSAKGYTPDNVQIISNLANTMKSNATKEELKTFAQWVLDTQ